MDNYWVPIDHSRTIKKIAVGLIILGGISLIFTIPLGVWWISGSVAILTVGKAMLTFWVKGN